MVFLKGYKPTNMDLSSIYHYMNTWCEIWTWFHPFFSTFWLLDFLFWSYCNSTNRIILTVVAIWENHYRSCVRMGGLYCQLIPLKVLHWTNLANNLSYIGLTIIWHMAESASSLINITVNSVDYVDVNTAVKLICKWTQALISSVAYSSITAAQNANHITRNRDASNSYTTLPSQTDPRLLPANWGGGFHWTHRREEEEASIHRWRCLFLCFLACDAPWASPEHPGSQI